MKVTNLYKSPKTHISFLFLLLTSLNPSAAYEKKQSFLINQTELEIAKWLDLTLTIEGYPIPDYSWQVGDSGCTDDGTREHWECPLTIYNNTDENSTEVAKVMATCETTVIDVGQVIIGELCDLTEMLLPEEPLINTPITNTPLTESREGEKS